MRVCACVHVHMCEGHPSNHPPPTSTHTPPTPRAAGSPKHQNSISLELIKIIQFWFEDSLPLNIPHIDYSWPPRHPPPTCPTPRAKETEIGRITITLERIEIIQFCLKICDPWTLLHTYRLGLMCKWGVSYSKWHFYVFDPKKCSCDPPIKNFPVFALDPIRPYLDWALRG